MSSQNASDFFALFSVGTTLVQPASSLFGVSLLGCGRLKPHSFIDGRSPVQQQTGDSRSSIQQQTAVGLRFIPGDVSVVPLVRTSGLEKFHSGSLEVFQALRT